MQIELLDGVDSPDPSKWGRTSEERSESGLVRWPGQVEDIVPCNAHLSLYRRAAFNRVLDEYKCVACSIEWPPVREERVRMFKSLLRRKVPSMNDFSLVWFLDIRTLKMQ